MRQPTVRRRRSRQQRLLRTGIGLAVAVGVIAILGNVLGGDGGRPQGQDTPLARVSFDGSTRAESDTGKRAVREARAEADEIRSLLDGWYQQAFVEVDRSVEDVAAGIEKHFAKDARAQMRKDLSMLALGAIREQIERLEPETERANVTVYVTKGERPVFAVASVRFEATATLKDDDAPPLLIDQRLTLHLSKTDGGWNVVFYEGKQTQESAEPSPTPSGSRS